MSNSTTDKILCTVYIDEAGDLGCNRGTQWFVLSAVIVDKKMSRVFETRSHGSKKT